MTTTPDSSMVRKYVFKMPTAGNDGTSDFSSGEDSGSSSSKGQEVQEYILRGLKGDDEEVTEWTEFCASVFADKKPIPPSASYFARHYYNDPDHNPSLIRVAFYIADENDDTQTQTMVASCRIFRRQISLAGEIVVEAGGIGEVCTLKEHRRRGLSSQLLQDCLTIMNSTSMDVSLLHAAPTFVPVYESSGYHCIQSNWSDINIDLSGQFDKSQTIIRLAQFPQDTTELQTLHQAYSEQRFIGCIIRSREYWNKYIARELDGTLWILEDNDRGIILGWISIRYKGDRYQLREFGCHSIGDVPSVFRRLFHHASNIEELEKQQQTKEPSSSSSSSSSSPSTCNTTIKLHIPTAVLQEVTQQEGKNDNDDNDDGFITCIVPDNDMGWMYKSLLKNDDDDDTSSAISDIIANNDDRPHLIWPADSF